MQPCLYLSTESCYMTWLSYVQSYTECAQVIVRMAGPVVPYIVLPLVNVPPLYIVAGGVAVFATTTALEKHTDGL